MNNTSRTITLTLAVFAVFVSGCETLDPYTREAETSKATKGALIGAAELLADASALEQTMGIGDGDRVFAAVPMSFSYGVGNLLVPALAR